MAFLNMGNHEEESTCGSTDRQHPARGGRVVGEVAKQQGLSEQGICTWQKRFDVMEAADVKQLYQLEQEYARLKKDVAQRHSEIEVMKEIAAKAW